MQSVKNIEDAINELMHALDLKTTITEYNDAIAKVVELEQQLNEQLLREQETDETDHDENESDTDVSEEDLSGSWGPLVVTFPGEEDEHETDKELAEFIRLEEDVAETTAEKSWWHLW